MSTACSVIPTAARATTIIKSKSNITNNRHLKAQTSDRATKFVGHHLNGVGAGARGVPAWSPSRVT